FVYYTGRCVRPRYTWMDPTIGTKPIILSGLQVSRPWRVLCSRYRHRRSRMTMRRLLFATGGFLIAVALAVTLHAAAGAHFVLNSGEHVSGELVDFGASGFTVRVGGQTRVLRMGQVAVIDFTGGMSFPSNEVDQAGGEHLLVLSSGQLIKGRLVDVGGTSPLRIT